MKILTFLYSLSSGGAERFVVDLLNEMSVKHDAVLYTLRDDEKANHGFYKNELSSRIQYINLKISPGFKFSLIGKFYKIIKKERPDVVHCHLNLVNYFFPLALIFHRRVKFFYTIHNSAEKEIGSRVELEICKLFFKKLFKVVAISKTTQKSYEDLYHLYNSSLIYNGRSLPQKSEHFKQVADEINAYKNTENTLIFCHIGRFAPQKNQQVLVTAFNQLCEQGYDVSLIIIGANFESATLLKSIANKNIHFLGEKTNIADYLILADAFCLCSLHEGMPISLIEAIACGCIPICTPVGGIVDTIEHLKTGFLSQSTDQSDYLHALKLFISQKDTLNRADIIALFNSKYRIENCAQKYLSLYQS